MAFDKFKGPLRNILTRFTSKFNDFIDNVRTRQQGWYKQYIYYSKSKLQQNGYFNRHVPKEPVDYSKPRYTEFRQNTNKFRASDKYRLINGSVRKVLPVLNPLRIYYLRYNDSDSDPIIEADNTRPSADNVYVGAY